MIVEWIQIQIFYKGLNVETKQMMDAVSRGSLCSKQSNVTHTLIKDITSNGYQWSSDRNKPVKATDEINTLTTLAAHVEAISKRLDTIQVQPQVPVMSCKCWGNQARPSCSSSDWGCQC